jgi:anti-anti-sigma regulatory factor
MNQKFQATVQSKDDVTYVKLSGVIDEDNELAEITEKIPAGTAVIDLAEIERINSCGVRDWVNWLGKIEKSGTKAILVECSPAIVAQINLVNNFTGSGVVKSFFAPYYCSQCDHEKVLLVEAAELGPPPHKAPTCRCDECDGVMDFDDMEDSYFAFLASARKVAEAAKITAVVSELKPGGDGEKQKIRSRVGSTGGGGTPASMPSMPSVPSLPSLARGGTGPGKPPTGSFSSVSITGNKGFGREISSPGSDPGRPITNVGGPRKMTGEPLPPTPQPKSSILVYMLVAVLIVAIAALAYLLFTSK